MPTNTIPNRDNWLFNEADDEFSYDILYRYYQAYMYNKCLSIFEWKNLPDDMITRDIEKVAQPKGMTFFLKDDRYYVLRGSFKDFITWNYEPKQAIIVNPALPNLKSEWDLDKDCICIPNDSYYIGLSGIINKYAHLLAQADLSINYSLFNLRLKNIPTANDSDTKIALDELFKDVWKGKKIQSIAVQDLTNSLKDADLLGFNSTTNNEAQLLIEMRQYLVASFYIEIGINANYNMKRESISSDEFKMNDDALLPLLDDMLKCRKMACDKINKMFGLNIEVDFTSSWKKLREELQIEKEKQELENEILENQADNSNQENQENSNIENNNDNPEEVENNEDISNGDVNE